MKKIRYQVIRIQAHNSRREVIQYKNSYEECEDWIYKHAIKGYTYFIERV